MSESKTCFFCKNYNHRSMCQLTNKPTKFIDGCDKWESRMKMWEEMSMNARIKKMMKIMNESGVPICPVCFKPLKMEKPHIYKYICNCLPEDIKEKTRVSFG